MPIETGTMIYCVIPQELEAELYEKLVEHYKDNPNVEVIVDRRSGPDRRSTGMAGRRRASSASSATGVACVPSFGSTEPPSRPSSSRRRAQAERSRSM